METFLQAEAEIKRLLSHYGLEGIPFPGVYLSEESAVAQVQWENFRLLYCIDRKNLPQRSSALIIAVLQKGEELLETLQRDPAPLAQFPLSHLPESAAEEYPTLPTDSTLEALLQNPSLALSQANQLDEFWEEAQANSDWSDHDSDSQTFHFNQARQLGILPPDENNDAS
jgi:hypothetical protein